MVNRWVFLAAAAAIPLVYACSSPSRGGIDRDRCEEDSDCDDDEVCNDGECVDKGGFSSGVGMVGEGGGGGGGGGTSSACQTSADCADPLVCDRLKGECVACRTSTDCDAASRCEDSACVPTPACASDLDCSSGGLLCDTEASRCVECNKAADCGGDKGCLGHSCVPVTPCANGFDCVDQHMACAPAAPPAWPAQAGGNACQECGYSLECPQGSVCYGGFCYEGCSLIGRTCGEFESVFCGSCPQGECTGAGSSCVIWETTPGGEHIASALDADKAYVLFADGNVNDGWLYAIDRTMGEVEIKAKSSAYLWSLAFNSSELFWSEAFYVMRMPKSGGSPSLLTQVQGLCREVKANEDDVFCSMEGLDDENGLYKFNIADGTFKNVWTNPSVPQIRLGPDRVYWTLSSPTSMLGYTLFNTSSKVLIVDIWVLSFDVTDNFLYWTSGEGGTYRIFRLAHGGAQAEEIFQDGKLVTTTSDGIYVMTEPDKDIVQISDDGALSGPILNYSDHDGSLIGAVADEKGLVLSRTPKDVKEVRWNP